MKKKIITYIMIGTVSANVLAGCGGSSAEQETQVSSAVQESSIVQESLTAEEVEENELLSMEEFISYFDKVEITTENWQDYFELVEQAERTTTNSWGEERPAPSCHLVVVPQKHVVVASKVDMQFTYEWEVTSGEIVHKEEGYISQKTVDIMLHYDSWSQDMPNAVTEPEQSLKETHRASEKEDYTVSTSEVRNIMCENVAGNVYILNIPDDLWNLDEEGEKYIAVEDYKEIRFYESGKVMECDEGTLLFANEYDFQWAEQNGLLDCAGICSWAGRLASELGE